MVKVPTSDVLMGSTPAQKVGGGTHVEKTPKHFVPAHVQTFAGSPGHESFQEHTHYSPTPGSLSLFQESISDVSAVTLLDSEA